MKTLFFRLLFVSVLLFGGAAVRAEDLGMVRARMEKRVSQIDTLKTSGVLGENNRGFLEVRSGNDGGVAVAENTDRKTVYAAIAQKIGVSADEVGAKRARKIAEASAFGVWLQRETGEWYKK